MTAPDRPGDRDQQQAAAPVAQMPQDWLDAFAEQDVPNWAALQAWNEAGDDDTVMQIKARAREIAQAARRDSEDALIARYNHGYVTGYKKAYEAARVEEAARWQAKIEALIERYVDGHDVGLADLRAVLDAS